MASVIPLTNGKLSEAQVSRYWEDGYLFPLPVISATEAADFRAELEALEAAAGTGAVPRDLNRFLRVNANVVIPLASRIAMHPAVLDVVEGILGPDLMVWSAEFFIKEARSDKIVSMHQDLTYWGMGETSDQVTAWVALSPATPASGCMDFVPGSHKNPILPHNDTFEENNLLSRGQEIAVEVAPEDMVPIEIHPGQMSLHHGLMFHGSGPNTSDDRRIACAIRYLNPNVRRQAGHRSYAMMVRGVDRAGGFIHYAPPPGNFSGRSLALHDEIRREQAKVLSAGAAKEVKLYSGTEKTR